MNILGQLDAIAEEQFELLPQLSFVNEAGPEIEFHEQVDVALPMGLTPGDGAEDSDIRRAVAGREPQDLLSLRPEECQVRRRVRSDRSARCHSSYGTSPTVMIPSTVSTWINLSSTWAQGLLHI